MGVDYGRLAGDYDAGRADEAVDREFWLSALRELGGLSPGERILDVGAGTGRFARLLAEFAQVVAFDASLDMLSHSRGKGAFERVLGDAHRLPFAPDSFDAAVAVMVLHQLRDYPSALREVSRVARKAVIATADLGRANLGILEEAFPSLLAIDRARFPSVEAIGRALGTAGFRQVTEEDRVLHRVLPVPAQLERVRRKYISTLDLIPPEEFRRGVGFLEREMPRRHGDEIEVNRRFTFVVASR